MKIIFLLAGEGRRFGKYSNLPKPLIKLKDIELIRWAVSSYNFIDYCINWSDVYFVTRIDHIREFDIDKFLKKTFSTDINIRYAEKTTRGPAETALLVEKDINLNEQVIVSDCDMFFNSLPLFFELSNIKEDKSIYGILPYVKRQDNQNTWSYCALDKDDIVIKVNEKDADMFNAGCPGTIGAYSFNCWEYFVTEAKTMIREDDLAGEDTRKEFYMSRVFQRLINQGHLIKGVDVAPSWVLGTPEQFLIFENFLNKSYGNR